MFEMNGYWQRFVAMLSGVSVARGEERMGALSGGSVAGNCRRDAPAPSSIKAAEKFLAIPTHIRLGRKISM